MSAGASQSGRRPVVPNYHEPPRGIRSIPGVTHRQGSPWDSFIGSGADLVAAGLLSLGQLPGSQGRPAQVVSYRPIGVAKPPRTSWHFVPGYMTVTCIGVDRFRVTLAVDSAEQERRRQALAAEGERIYPSGELPTATGGWPFPRVDVRRVQALSSAALAAIENTLSGALETAERLKPQAERARAQSAARSLRLVWSQSQSTRGAL